MGAARSWTPIHGGCQCGAVRYRLNAPAKLLSHCHCSMCRKTHGAMFATYSSVARNQLAIETGLEHLAVYRSSATVQRSFCRICGCALFFEADEDLGVIDFATGTLDGGAHPGHPSEEEMHIFVGSKVPWYEITDGLPQFDEDIEQ